MQVGHLVGGRRQRGCMCAHLHSDPTCPGLGLTEVQQASRGQTAGMTMTQAGGWQVITSPCSA